MQKKKGKSQEFNNSLILEILHHFFVLFARYFIIKGFVYSVQVMCWILEEFCGLDTS